MRECSLTRQGLQLSLMFHFLLFHALCCSHITHALGLWFYAVVPSIPNFAAISGDAAFILPLHFS